MSRIAVIATGPFPRDDTRFFSGQCLRTWHFVRPLLDAGHTILLFTHPIDDRAFRPGTDPVAREDEYRGLAYFALQTNREDLALPEIECRLEAFRPAALLGVNPFPAYLACRLRWRAPLWADLNGYGPAEGQTHCALLGDDTPLEHFWRMEFQTLRRADRISTVSRRQRLATLGELAIAGRLNRPNAAYTDFVTCIPNAVNDRYREFSPPPPVLRGREIPENAFLTLWSGGFNTWTDIETLHAALERVMAERPEVHFAATGGAIAGHDEQTFARFQRLAAASPHAARYHLLGWVESQVVDALFGEADLGISLDAENFETLFGARNRLTTMMACGLPVLTTRGTEISEDIEHAGCGFLAPVGDPAALAESIRRAIAARADGSLARLAAAGREWALAEFSPEKTTAPLLQWAARPAWAPDNAERLRLESTRAGPAPRRLDETPLHPLDDLLSAWERERYEALRRDERDLRAIRAKPFWRLARRLKGLLRRRR